MEAEFYHGNEQMETATAIVLQIGCSNFKKEKKQICITMLNNKNLIISCVKQNGIFEDFCVI